MNNRLNKIVELHDKQKYYVLNQVIISNESILLLQKINEKETELLHETLIVKENFDNEIEYLTKISDKKTLKTIIKYLIPEIEV